MNIPQYLARCAQLGVVPLDHKPTEAANTTAKPTYWWVLITIAIAIVSATSVISLLVYAEQSKHGAYLLLALIAAYLHSLDGQELDSTGPDQ